MPPNLYIKNALRMAELGLGDGTIYASATSAVPNQADNTFTLSGFSLDILTGPDADDLLNGYLLYFPASGNKYHVVDWVAGTDQATTWETPAAVDTGPCEFRKALFDNNALAANPLFYAADGRRDKKWKRSVLGDITISLPNLIKENAGFESGSTVGWSTIAGTPTINSVSPILGGFDLSMPAGARIWHLLRGPLKKTTYRVLFKASAAIWSNSLSVKLPSQGFNTLLDYTLSGQSSGSISGGNWFPGLTASNAWHWADITLNTHNEGDAFIAFDNNGGSQQPFSMDEVYVFEKINVGSYLLFDETDSSSTVVSITGYLAPDVRLGITAGVDTSVFLSSTQVNHHAVAEFAGGVFPIYKITFNFLPPNASEILLSEKWAIPYEPVDPFRPNFKKNHQKRITSASGIERRLRRFQRKTRKGTFEALSDADLKKYLEDWIPHHFDDDYPFAIQWAAGEVPMLMINADDTAGEIYNKLLPDWNFNFEEVI